MPTFNQQVSFGQPATDYAFDANAIERQRRLAEALQQQSMEGLPVGQQVGGWAIPISPWQGAAKIAQALVGRSGQERADESERALTQRYQTELADTLARGTAAMQGVPGESGPDLMRAAQIFAGHPATQGTSQQLLAQALQEQRRRQIMSELGMGQGGATVPASTAPDGGQGNAIPAAPAGPANAPSARVTAMLLSGDPALTKLGEEQAKIEAETRKPVNVRPGGTVWMPGQGAVFNAPSAVPGGYVQYGAGGPTAQVLPGAAEIAGHQAGTVTGATEAARLPYAPPSVVNTEGAPTLMTPAQQIQAATGAMPAGVAPAQQPAAAAGGGQPMNNPGNLRPVGADSGFRQFAMPQEGLQALDQDLAAKGRQGLNTINQIIAKYAPPTENNTAAYIDSVAKRLGISPGQPLNMDDPRVRHALSAAIMLQEDRSFLKAPQAPGTRGPGGLGMRLQDQGAGAQQRKFGEERGQLEANAPIARAAVADATTNLTRMEAEAKAILADPAVSRITGVTGAFPDIPGSAASDVRARLGALKSQVGFAVLQAMRDASKTGGALGQITDKENELLQRNLAALDTSQSTEALRRNIVQVIQYAQGARERIERGYRDTYERVVGTQGMQPSTLGAKPEGTTAPADTGGFQLVGVRR